MANQGHTRCMRKFHTKHLILVTKEILHFSQLDQLTSFRLATSEHTKKTIRVIHDLILTTHVLS